MTVNLSEAAEGVLISTGTGRQGAVPTHPITWAVERELRAARLLGPGGGLTRRGTIARERIVSRGLEAAFGI